MVRIKRAFVPRTGWRDNADEIEIPADHITKPGAEAPPSRETGTGRSIFMVPALPWKDT